MSKKNKGSEEEPTSFTREQLERFDGKNNRPLYIAFRGKIYDVTRSRLWVAGRHMGVHIRDENLTETIKNAPHGEETLARFSIVGELKEELARAPAQPTAPKPLEKMVEKPTEAPPAFPMERRDFLKLAAAAGGAITLAALTSSLKTLAFTPPITGQLSWPRIDVLNIKSLQLLKPVVFNYPLTNTPNFLVKLGVRADNGVGPDGDIVAFSDICQHLGCFYGFLAPGSSPPCKSSYTADIPQGYCCCHGSQYDFVHGARVISGPAPRPVPQVTLEYQQDTGEIFAVAMGPPTIFGHGPAGTTDPALVLKYDLQGGDVVTGGL